MDSAQELRHRTTQTNQEQDTTTNVKDEKKKAMAKRGLRSLAVAIALPLSMTVANIYLFGRPPGDQTYRINVSKPVWFPPLWLLNFMCVVYSALMGLSAWLVWAEGGFHRKPTAAAMYMAQLFLSLAWNPIMFRTGASRVGLFVCLALLVSVFQCFQVFKNVNPIAGAIVKPCLAWVGFLSVVNLKLVYL
ncbi:translocator protein-like [Heracleum sosnowskyi]|uniref:Translocator protein-like n=1 Tax=Heracleum sosnowskyi TaxID=360622 RepID=A0AAD8IHR0_9APIA|nr:translocator protein-like [Heracleum sosnowskyi]